MRKKIQWCRTALATIKLTINLGACLGPDNSWFLLQRIETLPLHMERHLTNTLATARHLQAHPASRGSATRACQAIFAWQAPLAAKYLCCTRGAVVVFDIRGGAAAGSKKHHACTQAVH